MNQETENPSRTIIYIGTHKIAALEVILEGREPAVGRFAVQKDPEGFDKGFVTHIQKATVSMENLLSRLTAGKPAGAVEPEYYVILGNSKLKTYAYTSSIYYHGVQRTIGPEEITEVIRQTKSVATLPLSECILQAIPHSYLVNDLDGVRNPAGLEAHRLGVYLKIHAMPFESFKNVSKIFEAMGVEVNVYFPKTAAVGEAVLTEQEKVEGAMVLDLSDGAAQLILYKEGSLVDTKAISWNGSWLTSSMASLWGIENHDARKLKEKYGSFELASQFGDELIPIVDRKSDGHHQVRRQEFQEKFLEQGKIWLQHILEEADSFAKAHKIYHPHYIYTGGCSGMQGFLEFLQKNFDRTGRIGLGRQVDAPNELLVDPSMAAPLGMLRWLAGYDREQKQYFGPRGFLQKTFASAKDWFTTYF